MHRGLLFLALLAACGGHTISGATCQKTIVAGSGTTALADALSRAEPGTCVVASAGTDPAAIKVPAQVTLGAEMGVTVTLTGNVELGAGAMLSSVTVKPSAGVGVALGSGSKLFAVKVQGASGAGVVAWCEEDCRTADVAELTDVELTGNAVGLLVHGARLKMTGGKVTGSHSTTLASGYGIVASAGASLELQGTKVEDNEELGVLIDGALGTDATLGDVAIRNNQGRGLWAQGLLGSAAAPKLKLTSCTLEGNRLVGLGARASQGISVTGGKIGTTAIGMAMGPQPGTFVEVGDGVGLFETTSDVTVDGVTLEQNARSQVLIDQGATGLKVTGSTVTATGTQLGVVVQRTSQTVDAPNITRPMTGMELPVSAPALGLPNR